MKFATWIEPICVVAAEPGVVTDTVPSRATVIDSALLGTVIGGCST